MKKPVNKVLIAIIIVIVLLAIGGGIFAYTYICTDALRTGQELFAKYLTQNISEIGQTVDFSKRKEINEKLEQKNHEENITITYTEADKTEPVGKITIDKQNHIESKNNYGIIGLTLGEMEKPLELEYATESDLFALRFTNAVQQFLSVKNDDLKDLATKLGIDETLIQEIPDKIDFEELSMKDLKLFTEEEKDKEIDKYVKIIYNNIAKEKYTKNKDTVITVNGKTIKTNSYVLTINSQDIKNITIQLLEALKQDEIILGKLNILLEKVKEQDETIEYTEQELKEEYTNIIQEIIDDLKETEIPEDETITITIYEQNKKTVRIKAEYGMQYITLDTTEVEGKKQIDLNFTSIDEDNTQLSSGITIIKENDNNIDIEFKIIDGEEQQKILIETELIESENDIKSSFSINNEEGEFLYEKNIKIVDEIDLEVKLDKTNNIILNELTEEKISTIFKLVGEVLPEKYGEPLAEEGIETLSKLSESQLAVILLGAGGVAVTEAGNVTGTALALITTSSTYLTYSNYKNFELNDPMLEDMDINEGIDVNLNEDIDADVNEDIDADVNEDIDADVNEDEDIDADVNENINIENNTNSLY